MEARFLFWCGALANMGLMFALMLDALRRVRRGDVAGHRREMLLASALVVVFLVAYVLKSAFIGREDFSVWSATQVATLRFHEVCVLVMMLAGGNALRLGRALGHTRIVTYDAADPPAPAAKLRWHRLSGRTAVVAAALGLASAAGVLAAMYGRIA